jgi:hypothetical protein
VALRVTSVSKTPPRIERTMLPFMIDRKPRKSA